MQVNHPKSTWLTTATCGWFTTKTSPFMTSNFEGNFFLSMRSKNGQLQIFLRCTCYIGNLYENVIVNYFYSTLRNQNSFQCLEIVKFWLIRLVISPKLTSFLLSSWRTRASRTCNGHSSGEHSQNYLCLLRPVPLKCNTDLSWAWVECEILAQRTW